MVGGKINKPRTANSKLSTRKSKKNKVEKKSHLRSEETVSSTTEDVLRQCRTNPRANVKLSGKKKRLLLKEAKRLVAEKNKMEGDTSMTDNSQKSGQYSGIPVTAQKSMDTT